LDFFGAAGGMEITSDSKISRMPEAEKAGVGMTPEEAFLLSRLDGSMKVGQLVLVSGLPQQKVLELLSALHRKGLIAIDGAAAQSGPDPRELEEEVDLDLETKKRVLQLYYSLERLNYYQLLGVDRRADAKTIKKAYFEASRLYHPDSYFRKNLGSFKQKIEAIFKRISQAYEDLSNAQKRELYDRTLPYEPTAEEKEEEERRRRQAQEEERLREERRRRLMRLNPMARRRAQVGIHIEDARKYQKEGNEVQAGNSARLALALDPENKEAKEILQAVEPKAARVRAEREYRRGKAEEELGRLPEALRWYRLSLQSYYDDPRVLERAARLMLEEKTDLRDAAQMCRRLIQLEPENHQAHLVLAKIFYQQNMYRNALRELNLYLDKNPLDEGAANLRKEIEKKLR